MIFGKPTGRVFKFRSTVGGRLRSCWLGWVVLVIQWSLCLPLSAQQPRIESLTIANGLSQGMIYDIEQTADGFLWFATKDGLNRFDGYRFEVFTNDPFNPFSIAGNDVSSLFEDSKGNLWLGIIGKGVGMMEPRSGKFLHLDISGVEGTNTQFDFTETSDGTIRVVCGNERLSLRWKKMDLGNPDLGASMAVAFRDFDLSDSAFSYSLKDSKGHRYIISSPVDHTAVFPVPENGSAPDSSPLFTIDKHVASFYLDRTDNLWMGTIGYGLRKVSLAPQPFHHLLSGHSIRKILAADMIYLPVNPAINAKPGNEFYYGIEDATNGSLPASWLPKDLIVYNMCQGRSGAVYFFGFNNSFHWFLGTRVGGKTNLTEFSIPLAPDYLAPLMEDAKGRLWTCTLDGRLVCFSPPEKDPAFFDLPRYMGGYAHVYALYEDTGHELWVGTKQGILRFSISDLDFRKNGKGESEIVFPEDRKPLIFKTEPSNPRSLRHNFITSFCPDPVQADRYLWVSTKGGGLQLLDKTTGEFQHFTSQNSGLPNDVVYGILPESPRAEEKAGGSIWGSTNRGLFRLTVSLSDGKRSCRFRNFRQSDGLQDDEFNISAFASSPNGLMAFGGVNGVTVFDPAEIEEVTSNAPVRLTGLKINNQPVDYFQQGSPLDRPLHQTDHIELDYNQNLITLEFALLDFRNPAQNRFRYRLKGVDPDWVEAGTNHAANYAHLRPGDYTFEVQGNFADGLWSGPATLYISVAPPWWATWWAYAGYAMAFGLAAYTFYRFRLRQKLEHQEALRLKELDEFKNRFFTNITHEFRTPLTVILGMADQLRTEGKAQNSPVTLIRRNGENLLRLINQLLDLSKLESNKLQLHYVQGDVLAYLRYIAESLHSFANVQNVLLRVESDQVKIVMDYDPERLLQITHNLLSNAIKFTPSGGKVLLRVDADAAALQVRVKDTGAGIPPEDLPHVFDRFFQARNLEKARTGGTGIGLSLTRELVKAMGGDIRVESEAGKGTSFTVLLPITRNAPPLEAPQFEDLAATPLQTSSSSQDTSPASPLPQILLVEDNPDVVEYLIACLGEKYHLDYAYNGRAGIEKALETIPDLIVSDVMMPEKDGFELCETLKHDERTSHVPIVLLTAKADAASKIAGLRRGADAYLAKPFDREELLVQLDMLLKNQQRMAAYFSRKNGGAQDAQLREQVGEASILIEDAFIRKVRGIVAAHYGDDNFGLPQLCQKVGMSRSQLFRKMTALMAVSPSDFIRSYRLAEAKKLLETTGLNVSEVAWKCGFVNLAHFSKVFQEEFGILPSATNK